MCEILQVHSPHSSASGALTANGHAKSADGDAIVISDSDDESNAFQSPTAKINGSVGGQRSEEVSVDQCGVWIKNTTLCVCVCQQEEEEASESVCV